MPIKACTCKHDFQDSKYGPGLRVFNRTKDGGYRCTVCTSSKAASTDKKKK